MKKILFSMLAVAAIASCAKTEPTYVEADSEIKLNPVTTVATKANKFAAITTAEYPTAEAFDVYAYWLDDADQVMETPYLTDGTSGVEFVNKGNYWGGKTTYYWPKNGSLRFAAYSPSSLDMTHTYADDTYTLKDLAYPAADATAADYTSKTYDILVAKTSEPYTAETGASKVSVKFEHALSWLTFKLQSTAVANEAFTVTKVVVNEVAKKGTLTADMAEGTKTWDQLDNQDAIDVFDGSYTVTPTAEVKENEGNGLLVLPQTPTDVTVYYTQNALKDESGNVTSPELTNQKITVSLVLDNADDVWEPGKHYTYTILFDLDEILINPTVEDWEETTEVIINSDPVKVSSSAELVAAISEGKDVVLADDIDLDKPVIVEPVAVKSGDFEVTIDLNGNDIVSTKPLYTQGVCSALISVKEGATLTINGNGTVNGSTTEDYAIEVRGGNLVVNGGTYVGAVTSAYALKGNITINGGTFKAENNGEYGTTYLLNLKDKNGADITVTGGTFYGFDPANNASENPTESFVAEGYGSYELEKGVWTVYSKETPVEITTAAALESAAAQGGNVVLGDDLTVETGLMVYADLTVNLNGKTLKYTGNDVLFRVHGATVTVDGTAANSAVVTNPTTPTNGGNGYVGLVKDNGTLEIKGGSYDAQATCTVAQVITGTLNVYDGEFKVNMSNPDHSDDNGESRYLLNCTDANYTAGTAVVNVYGGSFYKFNPANNASEGASTDYVPTGYKVLVDGDYYTVVAE